MIVKVINVNGRKKPDLPNGISFNRIKEIDETTWEISAPEYEAELEKKALRAVSQLVTAERILDERLPKERISDFAKVFDEPRAGQVYKKDWILRDPLTNELFAVIKNQVTFQAHWKMGDIASEFKPFRDDAVVNPWVQPLSTNPYPLGAKVTHKDQTWESMHPANVWEPSVVGHNIWKPL